MKYLGTGLGSGQHVKSQAWKNKTDLLRKYRKKLIDWRLKRKGKIIGKEEMINEVKKWWKRRKSRL